LIVGLDRVNPAAFALTAPAQNIKAEKRAMAFADMMVSSGKIGR
jgi:hypothetical protein